MRRWHELVADVGDAVPGGVPGLGLILLTLVTVVALLWYWWPEWWRALVRAGSRLVAGLAGRFRAGRRPRPRWPRLRRPRLGWARWRQRWRWRRRHRSMVPDDHEELPPDALPELPAVALVLSADELAALGRYKEAVRERLRAIVRELVERGVIEHRPGWTVTELAAIAGRARPAAAAPLAAACGIFSGIWYGRWEALARHDAAMREHAARVRAVLDDRRVGV
jgi:hypothetical protein